MIRFRNKYDRRKVGKSIANLENEIWKDIADGYGISNYGRILSLAKNTIRGRKYDKILTASKKNNGYYTVNINGINEYVHRLVACAFLPNPNNLKEVNHKDKDKSNNIVTNLEWCTGEYNVAYSIGIKVKQIDATTKKVIAVYDSANQAAKVIEGNNTGILMCCRRIKYNTYKGYIWRFINDDDYSTKYKAKIIRIDSNNIETIYNSVKEAAKNNNVSIYAIYNCLYNKSKTCAGYDWIKR